MQDKIKRKCPHCGYAEDELGTSERIIIGTIYAVLKRHFGK